MQRIAPELPILESRMEQPSSEIVEPIIVLESEQCEELVAHYSFGELALFSAAGPLKFGGNEDGALVFPLGPDRAVLAVADGVGGQPAGAHASSLALRSLRQALELARTPGFPLREAILVGIERANNAVIDLGAGAATTLSAIEVGKGFVRSYSVGDSGVLGFTPDGELKMQTIAHSPVGYAIEAGVLDEEEAMGHIDRHLVSNVIGDSHMHVEVGSAIEIEPSDTYVIASDGLLDNLHTPEIVRFLHRGPLSEATRAMVAECRRRMLQPAQGLPSKPDDLTLIAFRPRRF